MSGMNSGTNGYEFSFKNLREHIRDHLKRAGSIGGLDLFCRSAYMRLGM
ncbi:MAG TPA: hypothetical protein VNL13_04430 [Sulfolobales archaeon]|nr:hypothetical protein [Sulfolobales archaeon]